MERAVFEIKQNLVGQYYFVFRDVSGQGIVVSKSFADRASLETCVAEIRDKVKLAGVYENTAGQADPPLFLVQRGGSGFTFSLIGFEGEVVFSSESYALREGCMEGITLLKNLSWEAKIVDSV